MRIGIDARPATHVKAGIGTYVRELLAEFSRQCEHELLLYGREEWTGIEIDTRHRWRSLSGSDGAWNVRAAIAANRECDVYLSTISYLAPWFLALPSVLVVHDMIAFDRARRPNRRSARVERATIRPALRRAEAIIAISESTRRDLISRFPHVSGKTRVIYDAAQERFTPVGQGDDDVLANHGIERDYVLAVGTLEPRKNLPRLIEAFVRLPEELLARYQLVLVGASGWEADETFAMIAQHRSAVRTLGFVESDDLPALYRRATLFAFPSLYEGFGLPVLEAMQSGTAVLAGRTSSVPEVGGDAVRYVDPRSVADLETGLRTLLSDPELRAELVTRGLVQSERFSWSQTAAETLRVLEAAGESRPTARAIVGPGGRRP